MSKMGTEYIRQKETGQGCPICGEPTLPVGYPCSTCVASEELRSINMAADKEARDIDEAYEGWRSNI